MKIRATFQITEFSNKIYLIKGFRSMLGCGLKDAKELVEQHFCEKEFDEEGRLCKYILHQGVYYIIISAEHFVRYTLRNDNFIHLYDCEIVPETAPVSDFSNL